MFIEYSFTLNGSYLTGTINTNKIAHLSVNYNVPAAVNVCFYSDGAISFMPLSRDQAYSIYYAFQSVLCGSSKAEIPKVGYVSTCKGRSISAVVIRPEEYM